MTKSEIKLVSIIGFILGAVVLPAAIWSFNIVMDTRDKVITISSDVGAIKTVLSKEIEKLYAENERLRHELKQQSGGTTE